MRKFTLPKRVAMLGAATALAAAGLVATTAGTASASATGCTSWGAKTIFGTKLPTGQYCFSVNGTRMTVNNTSSTFNTGWIGQPMERVEFYNNSGGNYANYTTFQGSGTLYGFHGWTTNIHGTAQPGSVCGELYSYGLSVARVCETIR